VTAGDDEVVDGTDDVGARFESVRGLDLRVPGTVAK